MSDAVANHGDDWTIETILRWTAAHFLRSGATSPRLDAELLLAHVLGVDRVYLYTHYDQPLTAVERARYRALVQRRARREPVAYLLGEREFFGRAFAVDERVLIPRPETEHLVEAALTWLYKTSTAAPCLVDVGTGSGALAVTLACELPQASVVATDLSAAALAVASANAARHAVTTRLTTVQGDLFAGHDGPFDLIVSNPPYVALGETLPADVQDYEPIGALRAGIDGLDVLRRLCALAPGRLRRPGALFFEVGATQARHVVALLSEADADLHLRVVHDLAGHGRVVVAERAA